MATVQENLPWATTRDELGTYLGISGATLDNMELPFEAATALADEFLNNPFVDDDGVDIDLPATIKLGVFEFCKKRLFEPSGGATMEKTGDLQKQWSVSMQMGDDELFKRYWIMWRLEPGL